MEPKGRRRGGGAEKAPRGRPRGRYHHGMLRKALVDATLELIAAQDASAVSLREVARRAGVSAAAPYHHFKDKSTLLAAVAEEGFRRLIAAEERGLERMPDDPAEALERVLFVYIEFAVKHPAHFEVMFLPELHAGPFAELDRAAHESFALLVKAVERAVPRAARRQPPVLLAGVAFGTMHGLATLARKDTLWEEASPRGLRGVVRAAAETLARAWSP
jgi:AcrR family transcriptional regulator